MPWVGPSFRVCLTLYTSMLDLKQSINQSINSCQSGSCTSRVLLLDWALHSEWVLNLLGSSFRVGQRLHVQDSTFRVGLTPLGSKLQRRPLVPLQSIINAWHRDKFVDFCRNHVAVNVSTLPWTFYCQHTETDCDTAVKSLKLCSTIRQVTKWFKLYQTVPWNFYIWQFHTHTKAQGSFREDHIFCQSITHTHELN